MITINGLTFWYKRSKPVLEDVTLEFREGGVYGVLGANGVGKTTLLQLIGGLSFPKVGEIRIGAQMPGRREASLLQRIFYVPVEFDLPNITVLAYSKRFGPFYPAFDEKVWNKAIETFGILQGTKLNDLSFGQKKKVLLSFAMASGCEILLFDEPTDGLDIPSKDQFRRLLSQQTGEDRTAIITTHHVNDIAMLLDHLVILKDTSLLLNSAIDKLSENMQSVLLSALPPGENILYSERVAGGFNCLVKNTTGREGPLDLELLFKAIQRYPELAKNNSNYERQI